MKGLISLIACASFALLTSGVPSSKAFKKFKSWYADESSQLILQEVSGEYTCDVRFLPSELNIIRELSTDNDITRDKIKALYEKYDGSYEFSFKVSKKNVSDILTQISESSEDYNNRLFYLIESIEQDFTLVTKQGELKPLACHYENNYGAAPFMTFHLTFEKVAENELQHFVYQDQFFGLGDLVFDLSTIEKLTIPKIK